MNLCKLQVGIFTNHLLRVRYKYREHLRIHLMSSQTPDKTSLPEFPESHGSYKDNPHNRVVRYTGVTPVSVQGRVLVIGDTAVILTQKSE